MDVQIMDLNTPSTRHLHPSEISDISKNIFPPADPSHYLYETYKNNITSKLLNELSQLIVPNNTKQFVDNISNIQALGASGNNRKNDKSFEDWLNEPKRSDDYMKIHLVPKMDYSEDKFIDFVEKRREIIFNKVSKFFE